MTDSFLMWQGREFQCREHMEDIAKAYTPFQREIRVSASLKEGAKCVCCSQCTSYNQREKLQGWGRTAGV